MSTIAMLDPLPYVIRVGIVLTVRIRPPVIDRPPDWSRQDWDIAPIKPLQERHGIPHLFVWQLPKHPHGDLLGTNLQRVNGHGDGLHGGFTGRQDCGHGYASFAWFK